MAAKHSKDEKHQKCLNCSFATVICNRVFDCALVSSSHLACQAQKYSKPSNHGRKLKFNRTSTNQCSKWIYKWIDIFRELDNGRFVRRITRIQNFQVIFVFRYFSVQFTWQWTCVLFNFLQSSASASFVEQVVVKSERM